MSIATRVKNRILRTSCIIHCYVHRYYVHEVVVFVIPYVLKKYFMFKIESEKYSTFSRNYFKLKIQIFNVQKRHNFWTSTIFGPKRLVNFLVKNKNRNYSKSNKGDIGSIGCDRPFSAISPSLSDYEISPIDPLSLS